MKTSIIKHIVLLVGFAVGLLLLAGSCGKSDINAYDSKSKLWFVQTDKDDKDVNDIFRSLAFYPGLETLDVTFPVSLIGTIADYDREFKVVVVDTLTTALPADYTLQPSVFRAGRTEDVLTVRLNRTAHLQNDEVMLTLCIVENEQFEPGYTGRTLASVKFCDILTQPEWWDERIISTYLGEFSKAKFEAFYAYSGRNDIDGLVPSELSKLAIGFIEYVEKNNIREEDGSEMVFPGL